MPSSALETHREEFGVEPIRKQLPIAQSTYCGNIRRRRDPLKNLIKRIKGIAFGFRSFANYRIRAFLYAGKPNWTLLATITSR